MRQLFVGNNIRVGTDRFGKWSLGRPDKSGHYKQWYFCEIGEYSLNYAALVLKSVEAFEVVLVNRFDLDEDRIPDFNDAAVRKLIKQANEQWTFEQC